MGTHAQQKLEAPTFWNKHGLNATRDAFKINRTTLYFWRKAHAPTTPVVSFGHCGARATTHTSRN